ncbi:hypothetical protein L195_g062945, partial [Trifolium pratense]
MSFLKPPMPTPHSRPSRPSPLSPSNLNIGMLAKGSTPPSESGGPPPLSHTNMNFGTLPKGPT